MKKMNTASFLLAGAMGAVALAGAAWAHHSTSAFDTTQVVKIEGEIESFRWINPHASIKINGVTEGDAPDGLWTIEMTAPNILMNQGWKRNSLQKGDHVVMYANPLKNAITLEDGSQGALYIGVVLADGSELGRTDGAGAGTSE